MEGTTLFAIKDCSDKIRDKVLPKNVVSLNDVNLSREVLELRQKQSEMRKEFFSGEDYAIGLLQSPA